MRLPRRMACESWWTGSGLAAWPRSERRWTFDRRKRRPARTCANGSATTRPSGTNSRSGIGRNCELVRTPSVFSKRRAKRARSPCCMARGTRSTTRHSCSRHVSIAARRLRGNGRSLALTELIAASGGMGPDLHARACRGHARGSRLGLDRHVTESNLRVEAGSAGRKGAM